MMGDLSLTYAWIKFGEPEGNDFISFKVGDGSIQSITWRRDNFLFVVYEDRAMVLNLNQARYIEIQEPPK